MKWGWIMIKHKGTIKTNVNGIEKLMDYEVDIFTSIKDVIKDLGEITALDIINNSIINRAKLKARDIILREK